MSVLDRLYCKFNSSLYTGGHGGEWKIYYINIDFVSRVATNTTILYHELEDPNQRESIVPAMVSYNMRKIYKMTVQPQYQMMARMHPLLATGVVRYYLNGVASWTVTGSEIKGETTQVIITDKGNKFLSLFRKILDNFLPLNCTFLVTTPIN